MLSARVDIDLPAEHGHLVRGKVLGPKGGNVMYIQQLTGVKVNLTGKGSGNLGADGKEAEHSLALMLLTHDEAAMATAKGLAENLVKTAVSEYLQRNPIAGAAPPQPPPGAPPAAPPAAPPLEYRTAAAPTAPSLQPPPGAAAFRPPPAYPGYPPPPYGYPPMPMPGYGAPYGMPPGYPPAYPPYGMPPGMPPGYPPMPMPGYGRSRCHRRATTASRRRSTRRRRSRRWRLRARRRAAAAAAGRAAAAAAARVRYVMRSRKYRFDSTLICTARRASRRIRAARGVLLRRRRAQPHPF